MPKYRIKLSDGRTVTVEAAQPPSEQEVLSALSATPPPETPSEPKIGPAPSMFDRAVNALPTVGGMVGGIAGGKTNPLGMALSGLGGMAGEAGRMFVRGVQGRPVPGQDSVLGQAQNVLSAGAQQAGIEGVGRGVGGVLKTVGSAAYRGALRPSAAIRAKTPGVVAEGLEQRLLVGPHSAKSKAVNLMKASRAEADTAVKKAAMAGASDVPRRELRTTLGPLVQEAKQAAKIGLPDERRLIAARARALPQSTPLQEAHELGRVLNTRADRAFKAERAGGQVAGMGDRVNQALAESFGAAVKDRTPGLGRINTQTATRYGLAKALGHAAERPSVLTNVIASGAGAGELFRSGGDPGQALGAALAVKAAGSPRTLSGAGIALNELGRFQITPQMVRAALLERMTRDEEP